MSEKKEYIERGALSKFVRDVRKRLPKDSKDFFTRDEMLLNFQQYVDAQAASDVEPVVRGELRINEQGFLECSACGGVLRMPLVSTGEMKRCYICGAHIERSVCERSVPHWEHGGAAPTPFKPRSVEEEMRACADRFKHMERSGSGE